MRPERLQVKVYLSDATRADAAALIPVFHRWIRDEVIEDVLIDVADYRHVHHGPAVLLIGHKANYVFDEEGGRPGLVCAIKRDLSGDLGDRIRVALDAALLACRLLEKEADLGLRFDLGTLSVRLNDRLESPNDEASYTTLAAALRPLCEDLYGTSSFEIQPGDDPKRPLTAEVRGPSRPVTPQ